MANDPEAAIEDALIEEFLTARGLDAQSLAAMSDPDRRRVLVEASTYAADRLAEVEARAHFLHELHGDRSSS